MEDEKKKIRIVSPAKQIEEKQVVFAKDFLEKHGFIVEISAHALGQYHYFSGTINERLSDFQEALDDPSVDFILCARGGYGCVQFIDLLDFTEFLKSPKLIIGYSDVTVFHSHLHRHFSVPSLHATAPLNFSENTKEALDSLLNVLNNQPNEYRFQPPDLNVNGEISAPVVGGNLSILYSLLGTNSDFNYKGKILFIEEVGEAVYAIDRMFYALKKANKLKGLMGVIVGGLTNMKDSEVPFGKSAEEVIWSHIQPLGIPCCFSFPAGHIDDNRALILGANAQLSVTAQEVVFCSPKAKKQS
jgi:muramoyltetrapeptide carboxypeptidase